MEMTKDEEYYVYEHWNDEGCFYVGAGSIKNNRAYGKNSRSKEWLESSKNGFEVKIIKKFNNREEAFKFEEELTIVNIAKGYNLVNKGIGTKLYGEANGMYGKSYLLKGKKKTKEHIDKISKTIKENGSLKGSKNPMFGISIKDRFKTEEEYEKWKKSCARVGSKNGNSKKIKVTNLETLEIKIFDTIGLASEFTNIPGSTLGAYTRNSNILFRNNFKLERI